LQQRLRFSETVTAVRGAIESLRAFGAVFRNPRLRRLQLAGVGSSFGSWSYGVALAVYAYHQGGARAVGLVYFARLGAAGLVAPWLAVLVDRFSRRRVMIAADLVRFVLVAGLCAVVASEGPLWFVLVIAVVASITSTVFQPAESSLLPTLVDTPDELTAANAVMNTIGSVSMFAGPALAGLLIAVSSASVVFGITAATFIWSATCLWGLPPDERRDGPGAAEPVGQQLLAGVRAVLRVPALRIVVGLTGAQTFVAGAFEVLLVAYVFQLLDGGNAAVGWLNAAIGVGGVLGVVAVAALTGRKRLAGDLGIGVLLWGAPIAILAAWANIGFALVLFAIIGLGNTIVDVAGMTLLQRSADDEVLGRVFGILESMILGTIALGALVAPGVVSAIGIRWSLVLTGCLLPAMLVPLWPALRRADAAGRVAAEALELLQAIPIFAPLPPPVIERLARSAAEVHVDEGETVFAQGDVGDRFYVVADGEADVVEAGEHRGRLARGEFFGEIALLREVPRTATIVAVSPLRLYALERDEFIGAVTGHAPSREAADTVVAARLPAVV
jgi:MFS family permease